MLQIDQVHSDILNIYERLKIAYSMYALKGNWRTYTVKIYLFKFLFKVIL